MLNLRLLHLDTFTTLSLADSSSVLDSIRLEGCNALADASVLGPLSGTINGKLEIVDNGALESLTGLENLVAVGSDLRIEGNAVLADLDALSSLAQVSGNMSLSGAALLHLNGL